MVVWYLEALAAMALSLSVPMAGAWLVQQRTGNSGWVDTMTRSRAPHTTRVWCALNLAV
jgi:steroid 5-alpha reductase family enzyme